MLENQGQARLPRCSKFPHFLVLHLHSHSEDLERERRSQMQFSAWKYFSKSRRRYVLFMFVPAHSQVRYRTILAGVPASLVNNDRFRTPISHRFPRRL